MLTMLLTLSLMMCTDICAAVTPEPDGVYVDWNMARLFAFLGSLLQCFIISYCLFWNVYGFLAGGSTDKKNEEIPLMEIADAKAKSVKSVKSNTVAPLPPTTNKSEAGADAGVSEVPEISEGARLPPIKGVSPMKTPAEVSEA